MLLADERTFGIDDGLGLGHAEHLVVWAWRRMVAGHGDCPVLMREFAAACGENGPEVLATLAVFLQILARASRRRLVVGPPVCLALTADERQVLTLLAAAQAGHCAAFDAHLGWLARRETRPALSIGARALANAFADHELELPLPAMPDRRTRAGPPNLVGTGQ
jgi:hypothetical protein